ENPADHKCDICGSFAEAAHEIRKPLAPKWNVNARRVAPARKARLEIPADAVEHLELEAVAGNLLLLCIRARQIDELLVVRGDGGPMTGREQRLEHARVRGIHVGFLLIRHALRLFVRAFHQPDARTERVEAGEILLASIQRRLQHDADAAMALLPERVENLE